MKRPPAAMSGPCARAWKRPASNKIDAVLIAAATAQVEQVKAASDPRLRDLAEWMTAYEQVADQLAELKTFMEHVSLKDVGRLLTRQIRTLESLKATLAGKGCSTSPP